MAGAPDEVLSLDGVWKRHRRWKKRPYYLKEALIQRILRQKPRYEEFWALRDFSLSLRRGETVGFCGSNGAGKSTVLKLISRIMPATHGTITARGRVAALLELGAGFLPDLTGRENMLLNSAILGLTNAESRDRMQPMVEFADLGDFIDSPVRTYSTGMYMRLGFAIASTETTDQPSNASCGSSSGARIPRRPRATTVPSQTSPASAPKPWESAIENTDEITKPTMQTSITRSAIVLADRKSAGVIGPPSHRSRASARQPSPT